MDGYSVWDEVSRDYDAETRLVSQANFNVASNGVMQFLALAQSSDEFESRLMLAASQVQGLADESGLALDEVTANLRNRWDLLAEARYLAAKDDSAACQECKSTGKKTLSHGLVVDCDNCDGTGKKPSSAKESTRKIAADGQCENPGCEENAAIGGPYCDRCSMLVHASQKTANQYVEKQGDKWVVTQKGTGKVLSHHDTKEEAEASFRAMMVSKHPS